MITPALPEGFVLDSAPAIPALPDGFVLDPHESVASDIVKSIPTGLVHGSIGLAGLPGDVRDWVRAGLDKIMPQPANGETPKPTGVGWYDKLVDALQGARGALDLPTSDDIEKRSEPITSQLHAPETPAGKTAETIASFVPAALTGGAEVTGAKALVGRLARFAVLPGAASEAAGEMTKGSWAEPYARTAAAVAAGGIGARSLGERGDLVRTLQDEGVPMTAGQVTGSRPLRWAESVLADTPGTGSSAEALNEATAEGFTRASLRRVGEDANRATPEVVDRAFSRIGNDFDQLSARNSLEGDTRLGKDLNNAAFQYETLTPPGARAPIVQSAIRDIGDAIANNGGILQGNAYQALRSRLSAAARGTNDVPLSHALSDITEGLDDAMERSIAHNNPDDTGGFKRARRQYRNMLVIERAAAAPGEQAAQGLISPAQLSSAAKAVMGKRAYARGQGDFGQLARAGQGVLLPLPQSGTAPRENVMHLIQLAGLLGLAGGEAGGLAGASVGAAGGLLTPAVIGRVLLSRPAQAALKNLQPGLELPGLLGAAQNSRQ